MHQNVSLTRLNKMRISKSTNVLSVLTFTQAKGGGGNFLPGWILQSVSVLLTDQLGLPFLRGQQMSSNTCNYIDYWVETIKQQTRAAYGRLVAGQSVATGLAYGP